ncbi:hypothetical protein DAPPUDRAFT_271136 [Daphnia pulex]|uniref:Uncharacterized protein n=1 Tax=Daphnia pulex TaxID=6669 RepID=E9I1S8_DAPPU|nr:hypothetical protein DAPPUDRAFT_271136 [Daphnia pulex]|eukprot:EFX62052.1 hypothetical protein DAPPUDRAFT_271136 [Daphnia pulex]
MRRIEGMKFFNLCGFAVKSIKFPVTVLPVYVIRPTVVLKLPMNQNHHRYPQWENRSITVKMRRIEGMKFFNLCGFAVKSIKFPVTVLPVYVIRPTVVLKLPMNQNHHRYPQWENRSITVKMRRIEGMKRWCDEITWTGFDALDCSPRMVLRFLWVRWMLTMTEHHSSVNPTFLH